MPTVNSIGTSSRDFSTLQSWEDAVPSTPTGGYIGECYNDSEFTAGVTISGHSTSSTDFIELTAAAGESFIDHVDAATNPQFYNQAVGVGVLDFGSPFNFVLNIQDSFARATRLQFKDRTGIFSGLLFQGGLTCGIANCIFERSANSVGQSVTFFVNTCINCLFVNTGAMGGTEFARSGGCLLVNCAFVNAGSQDATYPVFNVEFNDPAQITNCAFFGFEALTTGTHTNYTFDYCGTDLTSVFSGGTGNEEGLVFADQYESVTDDFRLKAGNDMLFGDDTSAYTGGLDIIDQPQPGSAPFYVGQWAYQSAGGAITGDGDIALEALAVSGSGTTGRYGSGAIAFDALQAAGSGVVAGTILGSGNIALSALQVAGVGATASGVLGFGNITFEALQVSGAGTLGHFGTGAITFGALRVSGFDFPPVIIAQYIDGTAFDEFGRMMTSYLHPIVPLPVTVKYLQGIAHTQRGLRYVTTWPGGANVKYLDGYAMRQDGVQIILQETPGSRAIEGLPTSQRGELGATTTNPNKAVQGIGLNFKRVSMTDIS